MMTNRLSTIVRELRSGVAVRFDPVGSLRAAAAKVPGGAKVAHIAGADGKTIPIDLSLSDAAIGTIIRKHRNDLF